MLIKIDIRSTSAERIVILSIRRLKTFHFIPMSAKDETRHISDEDVAVLLKYYDKDHDGKISYEEAKAIIGNTAGLLNSFNHVKSAFHYSADCKTNKIKDAELLKVIEKFDANHDGKIDENEIVVGSVRLVLISCEESSLFI